MSYSYVVNQIFIMVFMLLVAFLEHDPRSIPIAIALVGMLISDGLYDVVKAIREKQ